MEINNEKQNNLFFSFLLLSSLHADPLPLRPDGLHGQQIYPELPNYSYYQEVLTIPSGSYDSATEALIGTQAQQYADTVDPKAYGNDRSKLLAQGRYYVQQKDSALYQQFQTNKGQAGISFSLNPNAPVTITHPWGNTTTITTKTTQAIQIPVGSTSVTVPVGVPATINIDASGNQSLVFYDQVGSPVMIADTTTETITTLKPISLDNGQSLPAGTYPVPH